MSRTQFHDPLARLAQRMAPEIRAIAQTAAADGVDGFVDELAVTRVGVDGDGNPINVIGFTIGVSAIGGPDGIGR